MILYIGNNIKSEKANVTTLQLLASLLNKENYEVVISSSQKNQILRMLAMLYSVIKYRKKVSYILIDTYSTKNFYYAIAVSQLARFYSLPYIPILHGGNLPYRLIHYPNLSKLVFDYAYINVAPSNYLKSAFEKHGYNTIHIPNIIEIEKYTFKSRKIFKPKLLYVRSLSKIYNPCMAIKALAELNIPEAKLCMVGPYSNEELQECEELSKKLQVTNKVTFKGRLTKKAWHKLAEEYDIFINTTTIDNTPISVMEAMALGLPVISTNVGGIPFLIDDNETGVLVSSNNHVAMANAVKKVIGNANATRSMCHNAYTKVAQYDWEIVKEQWKAILK